MTQPDRADLFPRRTTSSSSDATTGGGTGFRESLLAAGALGSTGIALGAFGAHKLRGILMERGMSDVWETAVRYQMWHALGLLALGVWLRVCALRDERTLVWISRCWTIGVLVFSGSLYALALGGPRWLGPLTPFGGIAFIAGWVLLIVFALRKSA